MIRTKRFFGRPAPLASGRRSIVCLPSCTLSALAVVLVSCSVAACGPRNELVAVDIVHRQQGDGSAVKIVTAIHVESDGSTWQATHAAGASPSIAPDDRMALSICQVLDGGPRGAPQIGFRALDLGNVSVEGATGDLPVTRHELETGQGVYFRLEPSVDALPYTAGQENVVQATGGGEAPGFVARVRAPPPFQVEMIGHVTAGAGTIPIPRNRDLRINWAPGSEDSEMFLAIVTAAQGLVCRVRDDGEFEVPRRYLSELTSGQANLVLERYNQEKFDTANATDGHARSGRARYAVQRWHRVQTQ